MQTVVRAWKSRAVAVAVGLCAVLAGRAATAYQTAPEHLVAGNQYFEPTPAGLRAYLETTRTTNPDLFSRLAPKVDELESRTTLARTLLIAGLAAGIASTAYGFASQSECAEPSVTTPNFAAASAAWESCNENNMTRTAVFTVLGAGLTTAGMVGWAVVTPSHQDVIDVVNESNRISPQPLQLQIGYDPGPHAARAGITLTF